MRWCAGIVNHGAYDDLERCLAGLARQGCPSTAIAVYDAGEGPEQFETMRLAHPEILVEIGANRDYAGSANRVVDRLLDAVEGIDFVLVLNPDVELEADYARRLIEEMANRPPVAIATGGLLPGRAFRR